MPEISVIVAVYNVEKYINSCVESILQQTYRPKEIILIDDGSTDSSSSICDEFEQNYDIVWTIHQENAGLSCARNTGIQNSGGGYCYFVDGDDYILPNTLENFTEILSRYPEVEVIHGRMSYFIDGTDVLIPDEIYIHNEILTGYAGQQVFVDTFQKIKALRMGIRGLYNRAFLIENNLYFKPHIYGEDQEWSVRMFHCAKYVIGNDKADYCYRKNRSGSLMNTLDVCKGMMIVDIYKGWEILAGHQNSTPDFRKVLQKELGSRFVSHYINFSCSLNADELDEFCNYINENKVLFRYYKGKSIKSMFICIAVKLIGVRKTAYLIRKIRKNSYR